MRIPPAVMAGANRPAGFVWESSSVQRFSHFRSSLELRKVVGLELFCCWPPWGPAAKRSGDGADFGQPVHLQVNSLHQCAALATTAGQSRSIASCQSQAQYHAKLGQSSKCGRTRRTGDVKTIASTGRFRSYGVIMIRYDLAGRAALLFRLKQMLSALDVDGPRLSVFSVYGRLHTSICITPASC